MNDYPLNDSIQIFGRSNQGPKQLNNKITVSPNPTQGKFTIKLATGQIDNIKIFNMYGASILTQEYTNTSEVSIDLSNASSSTYIIQIASGENVYSEKIILAH